MKILLLGGNGYIGSKFYESYKDSYDMISFDLCLFGKDLGHSVKINMRELVDVGLSQYDAIVCLAGHSSVQMCEYSPDRSWINNVEYFRKLCDGITSNTKLIYASSASVYGSLTTVSNEATPINFDTINHYDLQKITIDLIANQYIKRGKNIVGLRFGTVNGVSPNTRSELMLNSMVKSAIETRRVHMKNPHIRRSILGINDLVRVLDRVIRNDVSCGQYNLASFSSTVGDMAKFVCEKTSAMLIAHPNDPVSYDFEISTDKILAELKDFVFHDTIDSIVDELHSKYHDLVYDTRMNDGNFVRYV